MRFRWGTRIGRRRSEAGGQARRARAGGSTRVSGRTRAGGGAGDRGCAGQRGRGGLRRAHQPRVQPDGAIVGG